MEEDPLDYAEDCRARAYPERQDQHHDRREPRPPLQLPDPIPQVLSDLAELKSPELAPHPGPLHSIRFPSDPLQVTEAALGLSAGRLGVHPLGLEVPGAHFQVVRQLVIDLALQGTLR